VNKPEPPTESLRQFLPKSERGAAAKSGAEPFVPQYLEVPGRPRSAGPRNLFVGAGLLLVSLVAVGFAATAFGLRAVLPLLTTAGTVTLLWIAARMRMFRQRNGVFLALGLVALLAAAIPFAEHLVRTMVVQARDGNAADSQAAQAAHASSESTSDDGEKVPLLTEELGIPPADPNTTRVVRVLKDSRVLVGRKPYLLKAGEVFPYDSKRDNEIVFQAKELRLSLPEDAVEVSGPRSDAAALAATNNKDDNAAAATASLPGGPPASAANAELTGQAQREAVRRYPALALKDSAENKLFVETYRDLKNHNSELLEDPQWPLVLADLLAKREGWERR
jgi:hypothetical protein